MTIIHHCLKEVLSLYQITKNGIAVSVEDKKRYIKLQSNGTYRLCPESDAMGIVVDNTRVCNLDGVDPLPGVSESVSISEINGQALLQNTERTLTDTEIDLMEAEIALTEYEIAEMEGID
jgi:DNA gyrase/topoisomerase IV subunit A